MCSVGLNVWWREKWCLQRSDIRRHIVSIPDARIISVSFLQFRVSKEDVLDGAYIENLSTHGVRSWTKYVQLKKPGAHETIVS